MISQLLWEPKANEEIRTSPWLTGGHEALHIRKHTLFRAGRKDANSRGVNGNWRSLCCKRLLLLGTTHEWWVGNLQKRCKSRICSNTRAAELCITASLKCQCGGYWLMRSSDPSLYKPASSCEWGPATWLAASRVIKVSIIVGLVGRQAQLLSSAQSCSMALPRQPPARGSNCLAELVCLNHYYTRVLLRPSRALLHCRINPALPTSTWWSLMQQSSPLATSQ